MKLVVLMTFAVMSVASVARAEEAAVDPAVKALQDSRWAQPDAQPKKPAGDKPATSPSVAKATCTDANGRTLKDGEAGYETCLAQLAASAQNQNGKRAKDKDANANATGTKPGAGVTVNFGK
jgi:hypothetical protein